MLHEVHHHTNILKCLVDIMVFSSLMVSCEVFYYSRLSEAGVQSCFKVIIQQVNTEVSENIEEGFFTINISNQ